MNVSLEEGANVTDSFLQSSRYPREMNFVFFQLKRECVSISNCLPVLCVEIIVLLLLVFFKFFDSFCSQYLFQTFFCEKCSFIFKTFILNIFERKLNVTQYLLLAPIRDVEDVLCYFFILAISNNWQHLYLIRNKSGYLPGNLNYVQMNKI